MLSPDLTSLLAFSHTLEGLKKLIRYQGQPYWRDYPTPLRYESVADHSWRLAMLVLTLKDRFAQPVDLEKALQMALMHDIAEIIAGDECPIGADGTGNNTYAFDNKKAEERSERELIAAKKLFSSLPSTEQERLFQLWHEFEKNECFEAKIVRALDKIEALMQVIEYRDDGEFVATHLEFNFKYWRKYQDVDPLIRELGEQLCAEMQEKYDKRLSSQH